MAMQAIDYLQAASSGLRRGTVVAFDRDGRPLVRAAGEGAATPCDVLDHGLGALEVRLGDTVYFDHTPFEAQILPFLDRRGYECRLVVIKASHALGPRFTHDAKRSISLREG
jgi:hypothetical protein